MINVLKTAAVQSLALFTLLIVSSGLSAQDRSERHSHFGDHPIFQSIEIAAQNGLISKEEALLQKFYAGFDLEQLDPIYRSENDPPIKCMVPVMIEYEQLKNEVTPELAAKIEGLLNPQTASQVGNSYISPSGNFILKYDTSGSHAVPAEDDNENGIPDYVEKAAFAADSSYSYMVGNLGFKDFIEDEPYEISFENFNVYGRTYFSGSSSRIAVNNNFEGFDPNTHPEGDVIGALYATIAHELKHSSQFEVIGSGGLRNYTVWTEMDATLMEDVVFPDVNDYYNYIMGKNEDYNEDFSDKNEYWDRNSPHSLSIFDNPGSATPGLYWHVTWMIYFHEKFGPEFWVEVWDVIEQDRASGNGNEFRFIDSMDQVLKSNGSSIKNEHIQNHMWHMGSGPDFSRYNFGFSDRENYPNASLGEAQPLTPNSPTFINQVVPLQSFAARYHNLVPSSNSLGQPLFILDSQESKGFGLGVVGYFLDGSVEYITAFDPNSTRQIVQTTWSWEDLVDVNVAVINTNESGITSGYTLEINSIEPDEDVISQNFPNPFNPTTRIEFALSDTKDVLIDVYDTLGRKVATLVDGQLNSGFHSIIFDGSGLASGVYLYRIVTNETVISKKMMLIK
tara:strand:- start:20288 stop:22147 length:1860 start_codon:yes stop_codon:yes gene_type:complete